MIAPRNEKPGARANEQTGLDSTKHYIKYDTPSKPETVKRAPKPEAKWRRTLRELLARSDSVDEHRWLHRFLAERTARDHTLPSTVSELEKLRGIQFERREVVVPGFSGESARVMAYRVAPDSLSRARELLGLAGPSRVGPT